MKNIVIFALMVVVVCFAQRYERNVRLTEESGFFDMIKEKAKKFMNSKIVQHGKQLIGGFLASKSAPKQPEPVAEVEQTTEESGFFDMIKEKAKKFMNSKIVQQGKQLLGGFLSSKSAPKQPEPVPVAESEQTTEESGFFDMIKEKAKKFMNSKIVQSGKQLLGGFLSSKSAPKQPEPVAEVEQTTEESGFFDMIKEKAKKFMNSKIVQSGKQLLGGFLSSKSKQSEPVPVAEGEQTTEESGFFDMIKEKAKKFMNSKIVQQGKQLLGGFLSNKSKQSEPVPVSEENVDQE